MRSEDSSPLEETSPGAPGPGSASSSMALPPPLPSGQAAAPPPVQVGLGSPTGMSTAGPPSVASAAPSVPPSATPCVAPTTAPGEQPPPIPHSVKAASDTAVPVLTAFPWQPVDLGSGEVSIVVGTQDEQVDEEVDESQWLRRSVPAWMTSCIVHMIVILVLAFIPLLAAKMSPEIELVIGYTDQVGEQIDLETYSDTELLETDEPIQIILDDLDLVDSPAFTPAPAIVTADGFMAASDIVAPNMGQLLTGRDEGMRETMLAAYGGSEATEAAVLNGLRWLQSRQDSDGMWSMTGKYRHSARSRSATYPSGGDLENKVAATAMAMLAFQGYGQTHEEGPHEEFRRAMQRAVVALLKSQRPDGSFTKQVKPFERHLLSHQLMYTQALATFAMCELYAMSRDATLKEPAQRGVDYLVKHQHSVGGWKYAPGTGSDLSVTGWVMMALQSARMGGLVVPKRTLYRIEQFLDKVARNGGLRYSYDVYHQQPSLPMTAEGMLCRQYLGWKQNDPRFVAVAQWLAENPINGRSPNVYYWYYATQFLHNMEGKAWEQWNRGMSTQLPAWQHKKGRERGSWRLGEDPWGNYGGRLYTTCMSIYMLEVYYRHLPIYSLNLDLKVREEE